MTRESTRGGVLAAMTLAVVVALSACTGGAGSPASAATGAATATPAYNATPAPADASAERTPTPSTSTSTTSPADGGEATPTLGPAPTGPVPSVGSLPTTAWTGIRWLALPGGHLPAVPARNDVGYTNVSLVAWRGGYFEFVWDPVTRTVVPYLSSDALTWSRQPDLDLSGFTTRFREWDAQPRATDSPVGVPANCNFGVVQFVEGAAGLILVADITCEVAGCGSSPFSVGVGMWVWDPQVGWKPENMTALFGTTQIEASGGPKGFVTLVDGERLMTSADGSTWTTGSLPAQLLGDGSWANQPVAFGDGFVVPGVAMERRGTQSQGQGSDGCVSAGYEDTSLYAAQVWWSSDGLTWSRGALPGTTSSANGVSIYAQRVDDHLLLLTALVDQKSYEWTSSDGRTWTAIDPSVLAPSNVYYGFDQALVETYAPDTSSYDYAVLGPGFKPVRLSQTGDRPPQDTTLRAFGPRGLLEVTDDGSRAWLGVPTSN